MGTVPGGGPTAAGVIVHCRGLSTDRSDLTSFRRRPGENTTGRPPSEPTCSAMSKASSSAAVPCEGGSPIALIRSRPENEVSRRADGQKFRDSLNDGEENQIIHGHRIVRLSFAGGALTWMGFDSPARTIRARSEMHRPRCAGGRLDCVLPADPLPLKCRVSFASA